MPAAFVGVGRDDAADVVRQPVQHALVSGADAQNRRRFLEAIEAPETKQQLRELVALPVHRELVVREHLQLTQKTQPVGVVPLGGVGQLAELDVPRQVAALLRGKALVALGKFVRDDQHADDFPPRLARRERARIMREPLGVDGSAQQQLVGARDERVMGSQAAQARLVCDRIFSDADVVRPPAEDQMEFGRRQQLRDDCARPALLELRALRPHLVVCGRPSQDDPERFTDGRLGRGSFRRRKRRTGTAKHGETLSQTPSPVPTMASHQAAARRSTAGTSAASRKCWRTRSCAARLTRCEVILPARVALFDRETRVLRLLALRARSRERVE